MDKSASTGDTDYQARKFRLINVPGPCGFNIARKFRGSAWPRVY